VIGQKAAAEASDRPAMSLRPRPSAPSQEKKEERKETLTDEDEISIHVDD